MTKLKMEYQKLTKWQTNSDYVDTATFPLLPWPPGTEYLPTRSVQRCV